MADKKAFLLRIDPALWQELERWAADDLRSVNGQVEFLLRDALRRRRGGSAASNADSSPKPDAASPSAATERRTTPARR